MTSAANLIRLEPAKGDAMSVSLQDGPSSRGESIRPIPLDQRTMTTRDLAILWGDLGVGVLVLVAGALLVPALGFWSALVAIVVGSVIGCSLLALAAAAGADHGVPTMVLFRPVLGIRGSWAPSVINVVQLVGWTAVELWAMSYVADLVVSRTFGFSARWLWLIVASIFCTALAVWGPIAVVRVWMGKFGAWAILAICGAVTVLALQTDGIGEILSRPGTGGLSFGIALDLVIALPVSWLPLVADYTRFSRSSKSATRGTFWGYLVANIWLYSLGALLVLAGGAEPSPAGLAAGILALAGGSIAGLLFLLGLLVGETDEAFADVYSAAISLQNIWPRLSQTVAVLAVAFVSTLLAAWLTMERYESFLFLIGSVFVPLFGLLVADYFVNRARRIDVDGLYSTTGPYWYRGGVRVSSLVPWIAGFALYHWILPTGPAWWTDSISGWVTPLSESFTWLNASIPSFALSFGLALALASRREPQRPSVGAHREAP
jgi:nucleobase:cation symporter-1, NCS1 family